MAYLSEMDYLEWIVWWLAMDEVGVFEYWESAKALTPQRWFGMRG